MVGYWGWGNEIFSDKEVTLTGKRSKDDDDDGGGEGENGSNELKLGGSEENEEKDEKLDEVIEGGTEAEKVGGIEGRDWD